MSGGRAATLTGWGSAFPARLSQAELWDGYFAQRFAGVRGARMAFAASGVATRHAVANPLDEDLSDWSTGARMERYATEALPLATRAVAAALDDAGLAPAAVGLLVSVSCTGYATPGVDVGVAEALAMSPTLGRLNLGHVGCHGAFPALDAAARYVATSGLPAVVLCLELSSLHVQPPGDELEQAVVHALFSDAAAAVVLEPAPVEQGLTMVASTSRTLTTASGAMTWRITDRGFRMSLSRSVADLVAPPAAEVVEALLRPHGLGCADVAAWAVHPGGPRILDRVGTELGLDRAALEASRGVLAEHGNCSSATILVVLGQIAAQVLPAGASVVALGFGPGLTVTGLLLGRG